MRYSITFLSIIFPLLLVSQSSKNLELVANLSTEVTGNDVWGFKHSNGIEYAIMGDNNSTRIFSLEDPSNPVQVIDVVGTDSPWRDIKHFGDYVYVVADRGNDGLLIIDMTMIDEDSISHRFLNLEVDVNGFEDQISKCHNLYINEDGFLYLSGCNISNGGVIIFDLNDNPLEPKYKGIADLEYAHDVFVRDSLMYASEIYPGQLAIYDIADKSNPKLLGTTNTPNNFTHNAWSSDDNKYVFTTDERSESFVGAYDISDPSDIKFLDKFKPIFGVGAIPHNTHFLENYLYTSWYTEGVIITDVTRPDNMIEIAHYDTYAGQSGGFNGCWGAYPFLPSGLLLASDRQNGLFILRPALVRASYLEGTVVNSESGEPVNGVIVYINSNDRNSEISDAAGVFKTGQCTPGEFVVTINHPDYHSLDTTITISSGEVTPLNIALDKRVKYNLTINTDRVNGARVSNTIVILENEEQQYYLDSGEEGLKTNEVFEGTYRVYAGKWGWKQLDYGTVNIDENSEFKLVLEPGFEDNFLFDFGWEENSNASSGQWVRGVPLPTLFSSKLANVNMDLPDDIGKYCYMTGNGGGQGGTDDVDNGTTSLTSDWFTAKALIDPKLQYYRWFFNDGGENSAPNDSLNVFLITPLDTTLLETITSFSENGEWIRSTIPLNPSENLDSLKIMFVAQDDVEDGHIVEAGLDGFRVIDGFLISTDDLVEVSLFTAFPNPLQNQLTIKTTEFLGQATLRIYDVKGRLILKDVLQSKEKSLNINHFESGIYFLSVIGKDFRQTIKLVKS